MTTIVRRWERLRRGRRKAALAWLGLRSRAIRPALFVAGVLASLPLVLAFVLRTFGWTIG